MGEEIAFENGRISDFQGLVILALTLDRVILHTVMHHSSTSTYTPNFIEIEQTFCKRTDVRTGGRTFETHFIRSNRRSRPKNACRAQLWCITSAVEWTAVADRPVPDGARVAVPPDGAVLRRPVPPPSSPPSLWPPPWNWSDVPPPPPASKDADLECSWQLVGRHIRSRYHRARPSRHPPSAANTSKHPAGSGWLPSLTSDYTTSPGNVLVCSPRGVARSRKVGWTREKGRGDWCGRGLPLQWRQSMGDEKCTQFQQVSGWPLGNKRRESSCLTYAAQPKLY